MLKKMVMILLVGLLIVASPSVAKDSKTLYEDTIHKVRIKYELKYKRAFNPSYLDNYFVSNNVQYTFAGNEDYEILIDGMMDRMESIDMEDLEPKKIEWYESKEFGFIIGIGTSYLIYSTVK